MLIVNRFIVFLTYLLMQHATLINYLEKKKILREILLLFRKGYFNSSITAFVKLKRDLCSTTSHTNDAVLLLCYYNQY